MLLHGSFNAKLSFREKQPAQHHTPCFRTTHFPSFLLLTEVIAHDWEEELK